jgi:hypothetical protein
MRTPWQNGFPPVLVQCAWQGENGGLADNVNYWPAKKKRDIDAANRLCADEVREAVFEEVYAICEDPSARPPLVVAPSMNILESQNVLAIGYARYLAFEMGWDVAPYIFQAQSVKRDFTTDGWFRVAHQPEFYGDVEEGRRYVIADDVCTMGGTIASLKGFIETKGGTVICTTAIAGPSYTAMPLAISEQTAFGLNAKADGAFAAAIEEELGHGIPCLTEPEGRFLLRCASPELFREGINGARNG